ncbi:ImuA family protein [Pseudoroseomonas globiformis]|uniref:ImuA family protein n=1 Tax=Teichococcus globiformis TaxID=2307229 RepID=A0ABV7G8C3_9PROT
MPASPAVLQDLRATLARIERGLPGDPPPPLSLCPAIDAHLPEGGLARGELHEIQAADPGAGLGFCALILGRLAGPVLWIGPGGADGVWAPGLQGLGLGAERLLLARYRQPADGLWVLEEALRSPALGSAVLQLDRLDMTASRRLQLAAEGSSRVGLLLRSVAEHGPSSAVTRWRVSSLPDVQARPRWQLDLLRCRAGRPAAWTVQVEAGVLRVEGIAARALSA